ncbi:indolepyruvate oxidoreductase subunit beta family protein [Nordella sp. HKS 07]|uniref:indolepyruvate oxidoreductase subunit beta family protein n=1 Tax=Nordella sp. HKS 07 TaxID=2712222 RepID=UPI0013E1DB90|nr:indolepyruvate oxidoreductase subunit beta family protein [Nordella sp. HKS 07]QIG47722.1 indolepyruvate oxidoreductase subunit beta family protein [Nordella sp. HKS 07]
MNMQLPRQNQIIKLAILAVGGQGGGVVSDWIVHLAEENGWYAQATSVPGVAQRTGATIYYIEMVPDRGKTPILALMPAPGDVDIVIAAELMEAGRAMMRGLVTPERTTLIASSHRAFAVSEKSAPGNGIANGAAVIETARKTARRFVAADLEAIAARNGSVISASLFGALAAAAVLPFPRESFEATIKSGGKGIEASLKAFHEAFDAALAPIVLDSKPESAPARIEGPAALLERYQALVARIDDEMPPDCRDMVKRGLAKVVEFQDLAYGDEYLGRLVKIAALDHDLGGDGRGRALTREAAKYMANAMAYDDVIRVARIKTESQRFERVREEVPVRDEQILKLTEFMHPRMEEVCGMLPARLGRFIEGRPGLFKALDRLVNRGRHVRSDGIFWYAVLYGLASLRRFRRGLLRHQVEQAHLARWLSEAERTARVNYELGVEVLRCRRLIKGYSDTHARGLSRYDKVLSALPLLEGREDGAPWLRRLREAALKDENGTTLDGALKTVESL